MVLRPRDGTVRPVIAEREKEKIKELALRGASNSVIGYPVQNTMSRRSGI